MTGNFMLTLQLHRRACFLSALSVLYWLPSSRGVNPNSGETVSTLETMRAADRRISAGCSLRVRVQRPAHAFPADRQALVESCLLARVSADFAISCKTEHLPPVAYRPPGTPGYAPYDYNADGNLVVWMRNSSSTLSDAQMNATLEEYISVALDPQGNVKGSGRASSLMHYQLRDNSHAAHFEMRSVEWAVGRGFSAYIDVVIAEQSNADGTIELQAVGAWDSLRKSKGKWRLIVDPRLDSLVHSATFTRDNQAYPLIDCRNSGATPGEKGSFATEGTVRLNLGTSGSHEVRVTVLDAVVGVDTEMLSGIRDSIAAVPPDSVRVIDYREKPLAPTVLIPKLPTEP